MRRNRGIFANSFPTVPLLLGRHAAEEAGPPDPPPFSPADLNPALWLDAMTITGLADAAAVAAWNDSSGQGHNVAQATGALQPTYRAAGLNGRPSVRFDGTNDYLAGAIPTTSLNYTLAMVVKITGPAANQTLFTNAGFASGYALVKASTHRAVVHWNQANYIGTGTTPAAADLWLATRTGTARPTLYAGAAQTVDFASAGTGTPGTPTGNFRIGGDGISQPAGCDISEIVLCSEQITDAQRLALVSYLVAKWGIV